MKSNFLLLLSLLTTSIMSAQLVITPGAKFSITGNMQLTLKNSSLVNNGSFVAGSSMASFTGDASSLISGSQPIQFNELEINKTNNSSIVLQRAIGAGQRILFTSGFLNLNGFNTDLGTSGHLDGEQEASRIIGPNGGEVLFNVNLNSPQGSNPANLGLFITSGHDLGNVIIKRGHQVQVINPGPGTSILRYYEILPANNTNPDATLRLKYFDGELNSINENSLIFFKSDNAINWSVQGFNTKDAITNFVEKSGINSFARFTLSDAGNLLPVRFILFNTKCDGSRILVSWKTAQEQNSHHYNIERSVDGIQWTVIGDLPAAGTGSVERSYSFSDNSPVQNGYYRIAQYDIDGKVQYTSILRSSCNVTDVFNLWPNPARDRLTITILSGNESGVILKLFDSKGALVKWQRAAVLQGNNQLNMDIASLPEGVYSLSAEWNNGQTKKTMQIIKQ